MARTRRYIQRHRPLITPRIEFSLAPRPQLPMVTPRMDFSRQTEEMIQKPKSTIDINPSRSQNPAESKIPKPAGEPGRPNSGGFTLEDELKKHGWTENDVLAFTLQVREAAHEHLDMSCSFRNQDPILVQHICDKLSGPELWPELIRYQNCWPVRSALKLALKYSAEASRRTETKKVAIRVRQALRNVMDKDS